MWQRWIGGNNGAGASASAPIARAIRSIHTMTAPVVRVPHHWLHSAWNFAIPACCVVCGSSVGLDDAQKPQRLCEDCHEDLTADADGNQCHRCGAGVGPYAVRKAGCLECRREKFAFHSVIRLGNYRDSLRAAVVRCKYLHHQPLLETLAELCWQYREETFRAAGIDLVVPVPQHWMQRIHRQHHSPDVLASVWGGRLQVPTGLPILAKVRRTRKQARLNRVERRQNQEAVFHVQRPERVRGRTILLVDDVLTTGATAHSAARELKAAGAKRIIVAVLARAAGPR